MKKIIQNEKNFKTRDPFFLKHNGKYYHCFTLDTESIYVACADTIEGLSAAKAKLVYKPEPGKEYSKMLWAPELHIIDNKCYIYVACCDGDNMTHRMYVLENGSDNPEKPYTLHGKITDESDKWAIDGTVFRFNNEMYFVWSGLEGEANICQHLYIAKMKNPYEISSERVLISSPEQEWEKYGRTGEDGSPFVNEGAFAFELNNETYLAYSASGAGCEKYCIAYLRLIGSDPLIRENWEKCQKPVFTSNELVKGAGHCSIISEDEKRYVFFHAWDKDETEVKWENVSVWVGEMKIKNNEIIIE